MKPIRVCLLYWEGCPSHEAALERLKQAIAQEDVSVELEVIRVEDEAQARRLRFFGSPTILVDGRDVAPPPPGATPALTCRAYRWADGRISPLPSPEMLRDALRRARASSNAKKEVPVTLKLHDPAPDFALPGVDGQTHALGDYADKDVLVVIFSCNHCPYVRAWEGRMVQIQTDYADQGVQFVAINANDPEKYPEDSFEKMVERARERGFNFPYLHDASQEVARAYGATRTPEVFVFDRQRRLRYHGAIDDNYEDPAAVRRPYLRQALDALLADQDPPVPETPPVGCTIKWK